MPYTTWFLLFTPWLPAAEPLRRYQLLTTGHAARLAAIQAHAAETFLQCGVEQMRALHAVNSLAVEQFDFARTDGWARAAASRWSEELDALNDLNREFSNEFQRLAQEDVVSLAEAARLRDRMEPR